MLFPALDREGGSCWEVRINIGTCVKSVVGFVLWAESYWVIGPDKLTIGVFERVGGGQDSP